MSKIYAFLANGFEEVECLSVVDLLRRANLDVDMVSITNNKYVTGSHSITIQADALFEDIDPDKADLLFLPGGMPGSKYLASHEGLTKALVSCAASGRRIAAICAAPSVLGKLDLLKGKNAVCYPGFEDQCSGAFIKADGVVTDGNITTARGLGYALELGLELIRILEDKDTSDKIRESIQYPF